MTLRGSTFRVGSSFESTAGAVSGRDITSMESVLVLWLPFVGNYRTFLMSTNELVQLEASVGQFVMVPKHAIDSLSRVGAWA